MHGWETRMLLKHYLERGVSKAELSRLFGVSRRTIHSWIEAGDLDRDLAAGETRAVLTEGLESAFARFGGVPRELLFDQMRACSATRSWPRRSSTACCTTATSSTSAATATGCANTRTCSRRAPTTPARGARHDRRAVPVVRTPSEPPGRRPRKCAVFSCQKCAVFSCH